MSRQPDYDRIGDRLGGFALVLILLGIGTLVVGLGGGNLSPAGSIKATTFGSLAAVGGFILIGASLIVRAIAQVNVTLSERGRQPLDEE